MDAELERRIREQLDRDEIWRVMQTYGRGIDRLDAELTRSCYWDDSIEDHGSYVGTPDDFIAWANETTRSFQSTQHGILNHHCDLQGDDAYCETYFLFTGMAERPPHLLSTGRYIDHFQKRPGENGAEWRIANRVCVVETQYGIDDFVLARFMPPSYTEDEPCQASRDRNDVSYHRPPVPRPIKPG